jgi:translocation and assembly module TamB
LAPFSLKPDGRLQASVRADDFPLDILRPLLTGISGLKGDVRLRLAASGALGHPALDGFLDLRHGRFSVGATSQSFRGLEARLELHDSRLSVKTLALASGGSLELAGWLDMPWRSGGQVNLRLKAADFQVSLGLLGQAALAADIAASGDVQAPLISGRVTPTELELSLANQAPPEMRDVVVLRPGQKPPPMAQGAPSMVWRPKGLLGRSRIDLRVQAPPGFKIKMGLGWMMASGGARLLKQPGGALTYHDALTFPNGVIIVEGKRFQLQRGSLDFAGRDRPDPNLQAKVYHKAGKVMVWINLAGLASDPQISFSSEPPMGKADILAAVFFGKTASELDQGQSQSMAAQALALLGQKGVQELSRVLGPSLAPDVVTVHDAAGGGSALEAGKYISPDLYLRYRQQIGEEDNGQSLGVEYRINRYFSLDSQLGSDRDTGLDLIVDFDFD